MKREATIGAAALLAITAVVGVSLQTGPKQEGGGRADQTSATKRSKRSITKKVTHQLGSGCSNLEELLEEFLDIKELAAPGPCYAPGDIPPREPEDMIRKTSQLKFVIALLPDPVHTHLPVLFDQFAVAIQEGAQDEKYDFDSSWFPWGDEDLPYPLLADQKTSNAEKDLQEGQPGIILFRKALDCSSHAPKQSSNCDYALSKSYREGLVVFVVGEEATRGIHREQFRNALAWIAALKAKAAKVQRVAILGPTFSGSLPSLAQVLSETRITERLDLPATQDGQRLAIFSGSVSGGDAALAFDNTFASQVAFHSFVQNDDEILQRFCRYITKEQPGFEPGKVAIISEDETAYGSTGMDSESNETDCPDKALKLYYPRDISALRGAYQTKSLFDVGTSPQPSGTEKRSLPTDLADPSGTVEDSIRSYGGNQTPLNQEAFLLEIVAALRELNARYILLRSSNTLDQLFLANFLRRGYPDGRIVIVESDLMFIRERGTTGLSGTMTLSTYPLFPLERDWTEHQSLPAADRVFSSDTSEGTYVAFRLLLNDTSLIDGKPDPDRCHVLDQDAIFVPRIACATDPPIPDYSPPFWTLADQCGEIKNPNAENIETKGEKCPYLGPATWLSVIGSNRFWPMASLIHKTPSAPPADPRTTERADNRKQRPGGRPEIPAGMKVFLVVLIGFSLFHAWCCWFGSYTAKPAFRAHFASTGDWRHALLVFIGSSCIAALAIVAGWGCGVFSIPVAGLAYPWFALGCVSVVCLMAWVAILGNSRTAWKLSQDLSYSPGRPTMTKEEFITWNYRASGLFVVAIFLFYPLFVFPIEHVLLPENRVLTYWRAMHLTSGVSPIVPVLLVFAGMYLSFWFTLHGLALFGPDRPCLPPKKQLALKDAKGVEQDFLRMFSQEEAAARIERAAVPLDWKIVAVGLSLLVLFFAGACAIAGGVPVRSLGAQSYAIIFLACLDICCTLAIVETWRLCQVWQELKRLLAFLDRLPLRRTMAALRDFSWGGVWKMSGNVLEVRYKIISRQMECMNHTIASLEQFGRTSSDAGAQDSLNALTNMRNAGITFAGWYSANYANSRAGDLTSFSKFQESIASASGTLLVKLLVPTWRSEKRSLLVALEKDETNEASPHAPPPAGDEHIRNAEEFVCLNYMGFIQNVLGRLRTMTLTIMLLLIVSTVATSAYPFDPQQALSAVLIVLFVVVGVVIVKVYADMHRDATLSHVTNTKPGELGTEFWFRIVGFGFAPLLGLLTRIFPGITDFIFSWLQPGISSLK
jgi:hypothetical protein